MQSPGAGKCLACIQETTRKLVSENVNASRIGHRGEPGQEKACVHMIQDQENVNK